MSKEWVNLWEQMDPKMGRVGSDGSGEPSAGSAPDIWSEVFAGHWDVVLGGRKRFCGNTVRRGADPDTYGDLDRIWPLREAREVCEETLAREDQWWDRQ